MKLAVFSESECDEAAVRILVEGRLGRPTEQPRMPPRRSRGVGSVFKNLPTVIRHLHYHTDADALVVVVDSNNKPVLIEGGTPEQWHSHSRLQRLARTIGQTVDELKPVPGRAEPIRIAFGLAVPAIEAWYCRGIAGMRKDGTEAAWVNGQRSGKLPYTIRELKHWVYGMEDPPRDVQSKAAATAARRVVEMGLDVLIDRFPTGFGTLARPIQAGVR